MATTRTFQELLNEFLPNRLLREELVKRDYILNKIDKDNSWKGGKLIVPFKGSGSSSVEFGQLAAANDISEDKYVRGSIDDYKEVWGSMIFNHRDIMDHSGRIPEDTFLKILPDVIEDFMEYIKMAVSVNIGSGPHFATVTDDTNRATGVLVVDRIDRFSIGQKCFIDDDDSSPLAAYVIAINLNTSAVTLSATRAGAFVDLTAYTVAQAAKLYHPGAQANSFTSLRGALLSAANSGSSTLHGVSKLAYPYLQAINIDGSSITAANILEKLFDAYTEVKIKARGQASEFLMSFKHFGNVMKSVDSTHGYQGRFEVKEENKQAEVYGWEKINITSVKGKLSVVGIQEMDDDVIFILDWKALTFRSNGFFKKRKSPEGLEFFEVRNTAGYQYIVDVCLFGELEVRKPGNCGIIYSISY